MSDKRDSIEEFTGDRAAADLLRQSLTELAQRYAGHPLGRQIQDVLDGRATMRELAGDPEFASMAHEGMRKVEEEWRQLSPEERAAFVEQSRQALEEHERDERG